MSDRCTVWVTTRKEDWPRAAELIKEDTSYTPGDDMDDERDGYETWVYEDVRWPDDLVGSLERARIPYKTVNSQGEYPEAVCVYWPGTGTRLQEMLDGELIIRVDRVTGIPKVDDLGRVREFLELESKFEYYCRTGELA